MGVRLEGLVWLWIWLDSWFGLGLISALGWLWLDSSWILNGFWVGFGWISASTWILGCISISLVVAFALLQSFKHHSPSSAGLRAVLDMFQTGSSPTFTPRQLDDRSYSRSCTL